MDQAFVRRVFDYADGRLFWREKVSSKVIVGTEAGSIRPDGYRIVRANGRREYVHRVIWIWHHGDIPAGMRVDHRDLDPTNNQVGNLRLLSHGQNLANNHACGVSRAGQKWRADFRRRGYLGTFATYDEARQAYVAARSAFVSPGGV